MTIAPLSCWKPQVIPKEQCCLLPMPHVFATVLPSGQVICQHCGLGNPATPGKVAAVADVAICPCDPLRPANSGSKDAMPERAPPLYDEDTPSLKGSQEGGGEEVTGASVPQGSIQVYGAGSAELNGVYTRNGSWDGRPMWSHNGFDLWYKIWSTHREWRLGKTNDYYYIFDGESEHPPKSGWELASVVQQRYSPFAASLIHPGVRLPAPRLQF